jgi:hypothetical protein
MIEKKFNYAGVSRSKRNGKFKVRFVTHAKRWEQLAVWGEKDIKWEQFITPLTKQEAVQKLLDVDFAGSNEELKDCLAEAVSKNLRAKVPAKRKSKADAEVPEDSVEATEDATEPVDTQAKLAEILARGRAKAEAKKVSKAEIEAQLADLEDSPY